MVKEKNLNKNTKGSVLIELLIGIPILLILFGISSAMFSIFKEKAVLREAARLGVAATQYVPDVDDLRGVIGNFDNIQLRDLSYLGQIRNLATTVAYNNVLSQGLDANNYQYNVRFFWDGRKQEEQPNYKQIQALHWKFPRYDTKNSRSLYVTLSIESQRNGLRGLLSYVGIGNVNASAESATLPLINSIVEDDARLNNLPLNLGDEFNQGAGPGGAANNGINAADGDEDGDEDGGTSDSGTGGSDDDGTIGGDGSDGDPDGDPDDGLDGDDGDPFVGPTMRPTTEPFYGPTLMEPQEQRSDGSGSSVEDELDEVAILDEDSETFSGDDSAPFYGPTMAPFPRE